MSGEDMFFQIEKHRIKCPYCNQTVEFIKGPQDRTYKDEMEYWMKQAEYYYHEFKRLQAKKE